jgi:hypothetical protein
MPTYLQNLEPLLAAAELYASVQEEWDSMSAKGSTEEIGQDVWDIVLNEKFRAINVLLAAAITYAKCEKNIGEK